MTLLELAKLAVENYIKEGKIISPPDNLPKQFLKRKGGVFVTIEEIGKLRGCIGTYLPTRKSIAEEIIYNSISSATDDYRFGPVQKEELPYLSYTVNILSEPKPVKNIKELNPKKFGIIVKTLNPSLKCGLLLPDLDDVDIVEQQIQICCQKAGINPNEEKIIIYKFTAEKYQ